MPVSAPWLKLAESIDFVRAVRRAGRTRCTTRCSPTPARRSTDGAHRAAGRHRVRPARARHRDRRRPTWPTATDELIRRLYEAPPDGFVAARAAAVADAKEAGDKAAPGEIGRAAQADRGGVAGQPAGACAAPS